MPLPAAAPRRQRLGTLAKPVPGRPKLKAKPAPPKPDCCDEPDIQSEDGSKVCINCGTQIEEANIVADVTFEEDARGAATVQGGFIGENARHARTLGTGAYRKIGGGERNAVQEIENNGRRALNALCPRLGVPQRVVDQAQNLFSMAARFNFSAGRRTDEVVSACLFAACRRQKDNTILLMDIAEVQKINVFRLGEVYKAMCEKFHYHDENIGVQHIIDIEPLINRYCRKLEFGPKTRDVATDAVRILKRMKRDWIVTGRHPAGLCGACIILAARMNNFRRSVREIVYVAKVADVTISNRVAEFRRTRASNLTVEQFREFGTRLKSSHDPPVLAYSEHRKERFEEMKRQRLEQGVARATADREATQGQTAERETIVISDGEDEDEDDNSSKSSSATPGVEAGEDEPRRKRRRPEGPAMTFPATQQEPRFDADGFAIPAIPRIDPALDGRPAEESPPKRKRGRPPKRKPEPIQITVADLTVEEELGDEIDEALHDEMLQRMTDEAWKAKQAEEAAEALERVKPLVDQEMGAVTGQEQERREAAGVDWRPEPEPNVEHATADELNEEFQNDPEVENCLLSESEAKTKEQIWVAHNEDWLRAQQEKELLKKMAEAANAGKEKSKKGGKGGKRKKQSKIGDRSVLENAETPIETPADAASAMLKKRAPPHFSKFVDYEMLARVYGNRNGSSPPTSTSQSRAASETAESRAASVTPSVQAGSAGRDSATPAPQGRTVSFGLQSPQATQQPGAPVAFPATPGRATSKTPMSPPATQAQAPQAAEEEDEEAYVANDNDYQSEISAVADGWGDDEDEREDIGEDDDAEYRRTIGSMTYGEDNDATFGGEDEEWG